MNDRHSPGAAREDQVACPIEPGADASTVEKADELFAHGLLGFLNTDDRQAQEARVSGVIRKIELDASAPAHRSLRFPMRAVRVWSAIAASVVVVSAVALLAVPRQSSAQAMVQRSIAAMQSAGDRRYELRIMQHDDDELGAEADAVIDMRSPGNLLIRTQTPEGRAVVVGADAAGRWAIRRDGDIERVKPDLAWPRWATVGDESIFAESVDDLLNGLTRRFVLERGGETSADVYGGVACDHVRGVKRADARPGVRQIDLWISRSTRMVERIEMRFDEKLPPAPGRRPGPPADGERDDRARPHHRPPPGAPGAGPASGDRGARGPLPPRDRPPLPPGLRGPGPDEDVRGPMGRLRPRGVQVGPPGGPLDGPGGPRAGRGQPPKLIVLERVAAPELAPEWFSPEQHATR